jgi:hypothetical protein
MIIFEFIANVIGESFLRNICKLIYKFIIKPPVYGVGKIGVVTMSLFYKNFKVNSSSQYDEIVDFGFEVLAFILTLILLLFPIFVIYYIL